MRWWQSAASDATCARCARLVPEQCGGRGHVGCERLQRVGRDRCAVDLGLGAEDVGARCEGVRLRDGV